MGSKVQFCIPDSVLPELSYGLFLVTTWSQARRISTYTLDEQCLTSPPTQYRLSGRRFYRSKDPTNSIKVLKEHKNAISIHRHTKNSKSPSLH